MQARRRVQLTGTNRPTGFDPIRKKKGPPSPSRARKSDDPSSVHWKDRLVGEVRAPSCAARPACQQVRFAGLVDIARAKHPIPSRTRPLSAAAPMVLRPKTRESRSPPNLKNAPLPSAARTRAAAGNTARATRTGAFALPNDRIPAAGWSSPVARQAHNLKVVGSNPTPATKATWKIDRSPSAAVGGARSCG